MSRIDPLGMTYYVDGYSLQLRYVLSFSLPPKRRRVMPLDKSGSKASVGKNIATEMAAGKPRKQAIAIALDTQRRAGGKAPPPPKKGR